MVPFFLFEKIWRGSYKKVFLNFLVAPVIMMQIFFLPSAAFAARFSYPSNQKGAIQNRTIDKPQDVVIENVNPVFVNFDIQKNFVKRNGTAGFNGNFGEPTGNFSNGNVSAGGAANQDYITVWRTGTREKEIRQEITRLVPETTYENTTITKERVVPVVKTVYETVFEPVESWVEKTTEVVKNMPRTVIETAYRWAEKTVEVASEVPRIVYDTVKKTTLKAKDIVETVYDNVKETAYKWVNKTVKVAKTIWDSALRTGTKIVNMLVQMPRTVWNYVTEYIPQTVRSWLGRIWGWVTKYVPIVKRVAQTVYDWVSKPVSEAYNYYEKVQRTAYDWVTEKVRETYEIVRKVPRIIHKTIFEPIVETYKVARTVFDRTIKYVKEKVLEAYETTKVVYDTVVDKVTEKIKKTINVARQIPRKIVEFAKETYEETVRTAKTIYKEVKEFVTKKVVETYKYLSKIVKPPRQERSANAATSTQLIANKSLFNNIIDGAVERACIGIGAVENVGDTVKSVWSLGTNLFTDFSETTETIKNYGKKVLNDPVGQAGEIVNEYVDDITDRFGDGTNACNRGRATGYAGLDIATTFMSGGVAGIIKGGLKEAGEKVVKETIKNITEEVVEKTAKEVVEETGEKLVKGSTKIVVGSKPWKFDPLTNKISFDEMSKFRYAQKTASPNFGEFPSKFAGSTIDDLAQNLISGKMIPNEIPVDYVVRDGVKIIDNTRSAAALQKADIPMNKWNLRDMTGQPDVEKRVTKKLLHNELTSSGSIEIRITSGIQN